MEERADTLLARLDGGAAVDLSEITLHFSAQVAARVLAGQRHPGVGRAMFFHTAGYTFPYKNMHYVLVAGGNAFYEKR